MTLKIGILSFAHLHAESYLQGLRALPDVEVMGLADDDQARGQHFARLFDARLYPSYEALLADQPHGVVVCSENAHHRSLVELTAQAGVPVLCEKPLATNPNDARAIVEACRRANVLLMTAFPMRYSTPLIEVKHMIDQGILGTIYACNTTNQGECPKHLRAWFVDPELAGGGALTDHIVHLADVLRWYLGREVREVYAQSNHILYGDEVEVETGGLVMLTFEGGTFATIDCSWSKPPYYPTWGGLKLDLIGEKGLARVDAFRQVMTVYRHSLQRPAYAYWGSDANTAMLADFVEAVRTGRPARVTGDDGLHAVEIVAAAYESARSGRPERVQSPGSVR